MLTQNTPEHQTHIPPGRLWFGAVAAAVAWSLQGFTCFILSTQACKTGTGYLGSLGPTAVRILIGCVSAAFLAVAVAAGIVSYRNWQAFAHRRLLEAEAEDREEYMALAGVFVAVTAVVGLIWASIPPIFFTSCNTFR